MSSASWLSTLAPRIERQMRYFSPEMRRKLTHDNAAALYRLGGA